MNKQNIAFVLMAICLGITAFMLGGTLAVIDSYTRHIVQLEDGIVYLVDMINDNAERIEALELEAGK